MRVVLAVGVVVVLAGCGGGGDRPAAAPTPTPIVAGPAGFAAALEREGFGSKDVSDPGFLAVGNEVCAGFADGVSFGPQVQAFEESDADPSRGQAENLVRAAVEHLCPEHAPMLP